MKSAIDFYKDYKTRQHKDEIKPSSMSTNNQTAIGKSMQTASTKSLSLDSKDIFQFPQLYKGG